MSRIRAELGNFGNGRILTDTPRHTRFDTPPARIYPPRVLRFFHSLLVIACLAGGAIAADSNHVAAIKLEQPGVPNLHRVTDNLYRSAQPTAEGMRSAERLGIKTVISLRAFHSDSDEIKSTKLKTEHIHFNTWHPEDEDVIRFLKIIANTNNGPFLVHCQHGADRTGTMTAIYRIAVQGWTKDDAIKEMTGGGFNFHPMWKNLVGYLNELKIDALKKQAGLPLTPPTPAATLRP